MATGVPRGGRHFIFIIRSRANTSPTTTRGMRLPDVPPGSTSPGVVPLSDSMIVGHHESTCPVLLKIQRVESPGNPGRFDACDVTAGARHTSPVRGKGSIRGNPVSSPVPVSGNRVRKLSESAPDVHRVDARRKVSSPGDEDDVMRRRSRSPARRARSGAGAEHLDTDRYLARDRPAPFMNALQLLDF